MFSSRVRACAPRSWLCRKVCDARCGFFFLSFFILLVEEEGFGPQKFCANLPRFCLAPPRKRKVTLHQTPNTTLQTLWKRNILNKLFLFLPRHTQKRIHIYIYYYLSIYIYILHTFIRASDQTRFLSREPRNRRVSQEKKRDSKNHRQKKKNEQPFETNIYSVLCHAHTGDNFDRFSSDCAGEIHPIVRETIA